ncbi:MAG: AAA family ATPase [Candidatus Binatia bacterium]
MYEKFFGFRDLPFRLTPDPAYLYLSTKHEEAFAHMLYGVRDGSGFIAVTGEIGSGKTTLVRALLRELRDSSDGIAYAYIFNPVLSPTELLQTINAELGLPSRTTSKKELAEALNSFLLEQKSDGRETVIIVDEAQNLDPVVLEQLRLLSNLETETEKLVHIVLIGQPELRSLLSRPDLRQLSQRITVRWHIDPLDRRETGEYLRARLMVAGATDASRVFTDRALDMIYDFSGGVPRLINIVAHRALLVAYTRELASVGHHEVAVACSELEETRSPVLHVTRGWVFKAAAGAGVAAAAAMVAFLLVAPLGDDNGNASISGRSSAPSPSAAVGSGATGQDQDAAGPTVNVGEEPDGARGSRAHVAGLGADSATREDHAHALARLDRRLAKEPVFDGAVSAMSELLKAWGRKPITPDEARTSSLELQVIAADRGLRYLAGQMTTDLVRILDVPVILELKAGSQAEPRFVVLRGLDQDRALLGIDGGTVVDRAVLEAAWTGGVHLLWKDRERLEHSIGSGSGGPAVMRLQALLRELALFDGAVNGIYGDDSKAAVRKLQSRYGLQPNGVVDPITQVVLYNAVERFKRPELHSFSGGSG